MLLLATALAGDLLFYERALGLVEDRYLYPELLHPEQMLADAARQAASKVEWLLVRPQGPTVALAAGDGTWSAEVRLGDGLPGALSRLEDAIRAAGKPIDDGVELRVELLRGVVRSLDRHSVVLHAEGLARFEERISGTLQGIGVQIRVLDAGLRVSTVVPAGPAERGGVEEGDEILRIDGVSTIGMDTRDASERLRGPAGSTVVLSVRRGSGLLDLTLVRDEVRVRNVTAEVAPNGVAVVTVDHFSELTHDYLRESLDEMEAVGALDEGLLIDLRGNTGGSLVQSADAADFFLSSGLLVTTVGRDGGPVSGLVSHIEARPDVVAEDAPIVVLMDHETASGSEILAGTLARLQRAILVGTTSYGKGTVQKLYQVSPDVKLKLTEAEYLVRGKYPVAHVGIAPDVALAPMRFGPDGAWWPEPSRERLRLAPETPLLYLAEEVPGWRRQGMAPAERDATFDLATAFVKALEGLTRNDYLASATDLAAKVQAQEDQLLVETFRGRGIDWSPRLHDPGTPRARVRLEPQGPLRAGESVTVVAQVTNTGNDLWRAAVRLRSVNGVWDDLVLPIGRLAAGETASGEVKVHVPWSVADRSDVVELWLEADGGASRRVGEQVLTIFDRPPAPVAVTLRSTPFAQGTAVTVELENRGDTALTGVSARFRFPEVEGLSLLDGGTAPVDLPARGKATGLLRVVEDGWKGGELPLSLVVSAEGYGRLFEAEVGVPRTESLRIEPPVVQATPSATQQGPGSATLTLRATDDRGLDHVVVLGGPVQVDRTRYEPATEWTQDKLAWRPVNGRRVELTLPVRVDPGVNRFDVVAEDKAGLRTVQSVYILGDPALAASTVDGGEF